MLTKTNSALPALLFFVFCCFPSAAFASWPSLANPAPVESIGANDVAVIVAVEDYLLLPDVPGAIDNANDWEGFFRNGLKVPNVYVLANQDATRESMLKFAKKAASDVKKGGTLWWVFIGHGAPTLSGKDGLLVGMDTQQNVESLQARGLAQSELLSILEGGKGRTVMLVDACFSGRSSNGDALAQGVQPVIALNIAPRLKPGSVVLTAARATEVAGALPGARRPAFSYLVLGALRGWGDDGDGAVTAGEATYFARRELRGVKGRQQTPTLEGDQSSVLVKGANEEAPEVKIQEIPATTPLVAASGNEGSVLTYMAERIVFDGSIVRQDGRILEPVPFYHALGRPDLAVEYSTHTPWMWITGTIATLGGIALMVYGFSQESSGWKIGGFMGGFFTMSAGITLVTLGILLPEHPVSLTERQSLAESHNLALRRKLRLGDKDKWRQEPNRNGSWWNPFSMAPATPKFYGVTVRF